MLQLSLLEDFLRAVHGAQTLNLLEVRFRRQAGGMGQCFIDGDNVDRAARLVAELGMRTDVYFGVAPRRTPSGGRAGILLAGAVWADCDDARATAAIGQAVLPPSIVVASGSPHGRHAYWLLAEPLGIDAVVELNRRLALLLGADGRCADAARILRPPGTLNFKHRPPASVVLERFEPERRYTTSELEAWLPAPLAPAPVRLPSRRSGADPLRSIPPATYARLLLGVAVGRSRKIRCPFHDDHTPSL